MLKNHEKKREKGFCADALLMCVCLQMYSRDVEGSVSRKSIALLRHISQEQAKVSSGQLFFILYLCLLIFFFERKLKTDK